MLRLRLRYVSMRLRLNYVYICLGLDGPTFFGVSHTQASTGPFTCFFRDVK